MSIDDFVSRASKTEAKKKEVPEANIERSFVKYAKSCGVRAEKLVLLSGRGWPDRTVFCKEGIVFFIEFKRKGKKITPAQRIIKRILEKLGFDYYVCDEIGQAERILNGYI